MNLELMVQGVMAEIAQTVQNPGQAEPGRDGEFEAMLREQSKAAESQHKEQCPENQKPEKNQEKQETKKPQENSGKKEEITEENGQLAAALVTSQPVIPLEAFQTAQVKVAEDGGVILEPAGLENAPQGPIEAPGEPAENLVAVGAEQEAVSKEPAAAAPEAEPQAAVEDLPVEQAAKPEGRQESQPEMTGGQKEAPSQAIRQAKPEAEPQAEDEVQITGAWQESKPVFQEVRAVPVKVAETKSEPIEVQEPEAAPKLAVRIDQALAQGETRVEVQLSPAHLGKLTVEITRAQDGSLSVVLNTATERAAAVLRQHSGALQNAMMNSAQAPVTVEVQQPKQPEDSSQFLNPDGQNQQNQQQRQQESKRQKGESEDFIQQLRLGLVGLNWE